MLIRVIMLALAPDALRITTIPDDAFYYFRLAENRALTGRWTFDGSASATGFHLLHAYLLVVANLMFGHLAWQTLYVIFGVLTSLAFGLAAGLVAAMVRRVFAPAVVPMALLPFATPTTLVMGSLAMESWLVVVAASLCFWQLAREPGHRRQRAWLLVMVGLFGSLARSDFGLLPGALFAGAALAAPVRPHGSRLQFLRPYWFPVLGAAVGLALTLLHTWLISGNPISAAVLVKSRWSHLAGDRATAPLLNIVDVASPSYGQLPRTLLSYVALGVAALIVLAAGLVEWRRARASQQAQRLSSYLGAVLYLLGFILVYRYDSFAFQIWYDAALIVPLTVVFAGIAATLELSHASWLGVGLLTAYLSVLPGTPQPLWPAQASMLHAGERLPDVPVQGPIGAWNAGILSYVSGRPVVNLDGLVNDDIVPYIQRGQTVEYLKARRIAAIADAPYIVHSSIRPGLNGFTDRELSTCYSLSRRLDEGGDRNTVGLVNLYVKKPGC